MSLLQLDGLKKKEAIFQYILDMRGSGVMLPYLEYAYIDQWLKAAGGNDEVVLLVLTEILPHFYEKKDKCSKSLKFVHKKILEQIKNVQKQVFSEMCHV